VKHKGTVRDLTFQWSRTVPLCFPSNHIVGFDTPLFLYYTVERKNTETTESAFLRLNVMKDQGVDYEII